MHANRTGGVLIGDESAFVRLAREGGRRADDGMTTVVVEVRGGPFSGAVRDDTLVGVSAFRDELARLYERLDGTATLASYEKLRMAFTGDGRGAISVSVEICAEQAPLSKLSFEMEIDQTFLPGIIERLKSEFPDG